VKHYDWATTRAPTINFETRQTESLMSATVSTRPDIDFDVSRLICFPTNPGTTPRCSGQGILLEEIPESRTETRRRRQFIIADDASCADNTIHDQPHILISQPKRSSLRYRKLQKGNFYPAESRVNSGQSPHPILMSKLS
jgi:hypothetical protein